MEASAREFRQSRLDILEFLASPSEQLEWQARTPSLDSSEIMCWWLDDFHPESRLFTAAFDPSEIEHLKQFNAVFEHASSKYPAACPRVEQLVHDPDWLAVVEAAKEARKGIRDAI
jgi:hypothetical protein